MNRLPWAPLNFGVFLIVFGSMMLLSLFGVAGLSPLGALPLVFAVFGLWLVAAAFIMPPPNTTYGAPREMVLGWGAILTGLGTLWYVGFSNPTALPVVFTVIIIVAGIGIVGYSVMKTGSMKSPGPVA